MNDPVASIQVAVRLGELGTRGRAVYAAEDSAFSYETTWRAGSFEDAVVVDAGTLRLVFRSADMTFDSLFAFAPSSVWGTFTVARLPTQSGVGGLLLLGEAHHDAELALTWGLPDLSVDADPTYDFDPSEQALRMALGHRADRYYCVGSGLLAGVTGGTLAEIVLTSVSMEPSLAAPRADHGDVAQ